MNTTWHPGPMLLTNPVPWQNERAGGIRWRIWLLTTVFAVALSGGCPHGSESQSKLRLPSVTSPNPEAETDMRAAQGALADGRTEEAARRFERFLSRHPGDPLIPIAHLGLGRIHLAAGDTEQARSHLAEVTGHRDSAVAERGRFYDGVALHLMGNHEAALDRLRPFVGRTVDPSETALLLQTIAAASNQLGDRVGALEALDALLGSDAADEDLDAARQQLRQITATASEEEIQRAADLLPHSGRAWPNVAKGALRYAYHAGNLERVRELAESLRDEDVELDEELETMALRAEGTDTADPHAIGAILPLTGRGREVGQLALQGMMLAANSPPTGPQSTDTPQLVFRDDAGDPERAVQALDDLVTLHRVIAVVGPMSGASAERTAARAQELGVPLITLSPTGTPTDAGSMVFRLFVTPEAECRDLVRAAHGRGARRYAVLAPDNAYGNALRLAFGEAVRESGGELVHSGVYPLDATAFGDVIAELERVPFDAIFIPDSVRKVALLAPALAAAGLWSTKAGARAPGNGRGITVLVPSAGFDRQLPRSSIRYLQGALFSAPFDAPTAQGAGRRFADDYQERFGTAPGTYSAYAYDAFQLLQRAVARGARTRDAVAEALSNSSGAGTAGPSQGFGPNREAARGTRILELDGNLFVPLGATPASSK